MLLTFSGYQVYLTGTFFHPLAFRFLLKGISITWSAILLWQNVQNTLNFNNQKPYILQMKTTM